MMDINNLFEKPLTQFNNFEESFKNSEGLNQKMKALIGAATANKIRSKDLLSQFVEEAKSAGASDQEITEAITISALQSSGTQLVWAKDLVDNILEVGSKESYYLKHAPETGRKWRNFYDAVSEESALTRKEKELIAVTQASLGRCPHCTGGHTKVALKNGCSKEEITEAILYSAMVVAKADFQWFQLQG